MTEYDIENLEFLLQLDDRTLKAWFGQASKDDIVYAQQLLNLWEDQLDREFYGVAYVSSSSLCH